jgi:DNA-binding SARP family transcriptional activator
MTAIEFRILGPLEVASGSLRADLQAGKERSLLAIMITEAGRVVSVDRLIDELWGDAPPSSAHASLRVLVSRLRKALGALGSDGSIHRKAPGYVLEVPQDCIDSFRFEALAERGRHALASGRPAEAARNLREGLELWRGAALADAADSPSTFAEASRLEEARLVAVEDRIEADLECGRHAVLVGELDKLVTGHPLRERLWRSMMLALYRSGRQSEALSAYQKLRSTLVEEMGVDPSQALEQLQQAILNRSPELESSAPRSDPVGVPAAEVRPGGVVTFLLTDIEGSAALWENDPESASRAVERHEKIIAAAVADHAGTLIKSKGEGDSCVAAFHRPMDGAAAAVDIQRRIRAEEWPVVAPVRVRIALHTGEAELREGDYYGRTLNRAARLRTLASGGQTVCSRATGDLIADDLPEGTRLVDLGIHELAGLSRPEHVLEIEDDDDGGAVRSDDSSNAGRLVLPPQLAIGSETRFVGRAPEREVLDRAWERTLTGQRRIELLAGEPGIGKTRLAAEFARDLHATGATVLFGGCDEELVSSYQPFVEALRPLALSIPSEILLRGSGHAAAGIARLIPEVRGRFGRLPQQSGEPETDRRLLFDAVNTLLVGAASSAPILLVLDDLHWADQGTLLLLRYLARHPDAGAVMMVGTYRDVEIYPDHPMADALVDLRRSGLSERVSLGGLSAEEIATLLAARAQHDLNPAALAFVEVLKQETEGNPFFIEELVRHLTEAGVVYRDEGRWTSNLSIEEVGIPEGIRDVVGRRIGHLPEESRELLTLAAVMGKEFRADALESISDLAEDALLEALDRAKDSGLIRELPGEIGRYSFGHSLVRDFLYHGLSTLRRARLHRKVGEALERIYGARQSQYLSELSHHFLEAADGEHARRTLSYTVGAGDYALSQLAYEEAAKHYERALEVLEGMPDAELRQRAEILLKLGEARWRAGEGTSQQSFVRALEIARSLPDPEILAHAALGLTSSGGLTRVARTDDGPIRLLEEALTSMPKTPTALRARVLARLADELYYTAGSERKIALAEEAISVAESIDDASAALVGRYARVWASMGPDTPPQHLLEQLAGVNRRAETAGNRELAFEAHLLRGQLWVELGDLGSAEDEVAAATAIAEALRIPTFDPWISAYRSLRAYLSGRFTESDRLIQEAISSSTDQGVDPHAALLIFGGQSMAQLFNRVDVSTLAPTLEEWVDRYPLHVVIRSTLTYLHSDGGDVDATRNALEPIAANGFRDIPRSASWTTCMWTLAQSVSFVRDPALAAPLYEMLSPYADRMVINPGLWLTFGPAHTALGLLAGVIGDLDAAEGHFDAALAHAERIASPPFVADACYRYAWTMTAVGGGPRPDRIEPMARHAAALAGELGLDWLAAKIDTLPA